MIQSLAINIQANGKLLANAYYYYWDGCTSDALKLANSIFESGLLTDAFIKAVASPTQYAIKLLESTGAGYTNRIAGLINSDPKAMDNTNRWAEASIAIDLVTRKVFMDIAWIDENYDKSAVTFFPFNLNECTFDEFPDLVDLYLSTYLKIDPAIIHCPDGTTYRPFE